jgi:hypothetical protein
MSTRRFTELLRAPSEVRPWTDVGRINCRLGVDLLLAAIGSPQLQSWTEQGTLSLIELLLIYFRCLLAFFGMEHLCAVREPALARKEIAGNRPVSPRPLRPRENVWLSLSHVLGRFGAPPGRRWDDWPFSAVASERLGRERSDPADPLPVLRHNEST